MASLVHSQEAVTQNNWKSQLGHDKFSLCFLLHDHWCTDGIPIEHLHASSTFFKSITIRLLCSVIDSSTENGVILGYIIL